MVGDKQKMTAGDIRAYGTATVAAGTPGVAGTIAVANSDIAATDRIVVTISGVAAQDVQEIKYQNITFQVIKTAGTGFSVTTNQYDTPTFTVDYLVFEGA